MYIQVEYDFCMIFVTCIYTHIYTNKHKQTHMNFILALSENGVLGENNSKLPWKIHEELEYFLRKVSHPQYTLVMGRCTFECIQRYQPELLKQVHSTYVLTNSLPIVAPNSKIYYIRDISDISHIPNDTQNIWCIGGASLYNRIRELCPQRVYLTRIRKSYISNIDSKYVKISSDFEEYLLTAYRETVLTTKRLFDKKSKEWVDCYFLLYILQ